ncbi:IgA peptidase M64-domain-containing protein [Cerioporus squamosus]|nr:IgA peptidase M64-domain-containing protein [Cerioporus squamosus]
MKCARLLGTLISAVVVLADDVLRPFELIVHRELDTHHCTHVALRGTQLFRALPDEGYTTSRVLEIGQERIQFIAREEERVWARAEALCGDRQAWDFHTLVSVPPALEKSGTGQVVLRPVVGQELEDPLPLEVEPLITSGESGNRVDLVFFADGYTSEEKGKFIEDALRLAEDISGNQTFYTVKPLLNFWAAFTPSKESGIGSGGKPKDTAFGFKPEVARTACFSLGDQCDYPILMGKSELLPHISGLGGEFTVITPSLANGPLVLRHELGHSIIRVGEEYDGGFAYFGVNAAHNTTLDAVPWAHWLTNSSDQIHHDHDRDHGTPALAVAPKNARVERSVMPLQDYAWTMLNTSASWSTKFNSSGTYAWHLVRFSLSGIPDAKDLTVELDGTDLGWVPRGDIGVDRWHYDIKINETLEGGEHEVKFTLKSKEREGEAQLCSVEILEFGDESEFVSTPGHYSLYPTFSEKNETSYRPTNEDCLMRIVTTPNFCKACTEGLWHALLRRVTLIDSLVVGCSAASGERTLDLALVPLAHLRARPVGVAESYEVTWARDGVEVPEWKNRTSVADAGDALGSYVVKVRYWTEEVKVDVDGLLESEAAYVATTRCAGA